MPPNSLKILREKAGFHRQNAFAKALGMPISTIANFETGYSNLSKENLKKISEFLKCSSADILKSAESPRDSLSARQIKINGLKEVLFNLASALKPASGQSEAELMAQIDETFIQIAQLIGQPDLPPVSTRYPLRVMTESSAGGAVESVLNESQGRSPLRGVGAPSAQSVARQDDTERPSNRRRGPQDPTQVGLVSEEPKND